VALKAWADGDGLHVRATGLASFLAFVRRIDIGPGEVLSVRRDGFKELIRVVGWRIGGSYVPRLLAAGWYTRRGVKGSRVWCWAQPRDVLVFVETSRPRPCIVVLPEPRLERRLGSGWLDRSMREVSSG
jgi:hypothetical protein